MSNYKYVIVETYHHTTGGSAHSIRARPLPGQGYNTDIKVSCSSSMRKMYPVGSKIKIQASIVKRDHERPFLYTHFNWPYELVSDKEANEFISKLKK